MALECIEGPEVEPVSLADLRAWTKTTGNDAVLTACGVAARQHVENWTGRALITSIWRLTLRDFPLGVIQLPRTPLQAIESVTWRDKAGDAQTMIDYVVGLAAGTIEPLHRWPVAGDFPDAGVIEFTAGYGDEPEDVPEPIRTAIKMLAGDMASLARDNLVERVTAGDGNVTRSESYSPALAALANKTMSRLLGNYRTFHA